jgi:hypothetical protein
MSSPEFPPNSAVSKKGAPQAKNIERVTSGEPVRRKKSLRKQFSETFVAGDAKSAVSYVLLDVLLPAAKDMIVEAGSQGIEKLIFGDSSRRRGARSPVAGPTGYVSYNRLSSSMGGGSRLPGPQRAMSRAARGRHNFDEIVLEQRTEAEEVIDRLFDLVSRYEQATVADLYELVGLQSTHTDHKWGWEDLHGAGVTRVRGGYLLDLPEPEPFD